MPDGWLLDTNIISATFGNKRADARIVRFLQTLPDARLHLSILTVGELRKGIELLTPTDQRRHTFEVKVEELEVRWADRILMVDGAVAHRWGELTAHYERRGQPMPAIDGLIAATAEVHNLVLVSHDAVFQRLSERVSVYDPLMT